MQPQRDYHLRNGPGAKGVSPSKIGRDARQYRALLIVCIAGVMLCGMMGLFIVVTVAVETVGSLRTRT